ncbi:carbohydrate ABC transporter permease [Caldicoprobacter sp.]|uniref:carbohydrate ABC transporter permease n=1 Tax=Caldicoprobacter sp. TaxID=2004500 RepID=UPI0039C288C0
MQEKFSFKPGYRGRSIFRICNGIFMALLVVSMLIPLMKVLSDSFDRSTTYGINLWPQNPSIVAYKTIFSAKALYRPLLISFLTTSAGTFLGLLFSTLGAYVLIQKDLIGRRFFAFFIFFTMIFSGGLVPTYLVIKNLGMTNTLWAVILPPSLNVYNMFLMKNFFEQIPESLFESASIDGASPMIVFARIVLPLSLPALASIGLFFGVQFWNDFFNYVIYITNPDLYNFQVKLRELILSEQNLTDPSIVGFGNSVRNAAIIVAMIPPMIIYPFCQRYFITGITMGAVKE